LHPNICVLSQTFSGHPGLCRATLSITPDDYRHYIIRLIVSDRIST